MLTKEYGTFIASHMHDIEKVPLGYRKIFWWYRSKTSFGLNTLVV